MNTDAQHSAPVITIDGPSGSGKGTISQLVAYKLGWHLLESGAMYRALALAALEQQVSLDDATALSALADRLDVRFVAPDPGDPPTVWFGGREVTDRLRDETTGDAASVVAAHLPVRAALLARQRAYRQQPGLVADGRDMGSAVFTDADLKIYLTASAEVRAARRYNQLINKGQDVSLRALLKDIKARDARDLTRSASPMRPAEDAVILDSSAMDVEQVLTRVLEEVDKKSLR